MTQRPQRPCRKVGCPNLTRTGWCNAHKDENRKADREYDKNVRDPKHVAFYKSREWQAARKQAIIRDHNLCQECLTEGLIKKSDVVDHIIELKDNWSLRTTLDNLKCLCHYCHNRKTESERKRRENSKGMSND